VLGLGVRVQGSGFKAQDSGFRVQGVGFRFQGLGFGVSGFVVSGSLSRVYGLWFRLEISKVTVQSPKKGVELRTGLRVEGERVKKVRRQAAGIIARGFGS